MSRSGEFCVSAHSALVRDGDWYDALDHLIRNRRARRRLGRRALRWARGQTTDRHAAIWETEFQRAIELAATRRTPHRAIVAAPGPARR
jgi:hypothetical protein